VIKIKRTYLRIIIISDTHGLLTNQILSACHGADTIIHAGDVGSSEIIADLESLAPLTVVAGNIDTTESLPSQSKLLLKSWKIFVQHIGWEKGKPSKDLNSMVDSGGFEIAIFGHSHIPLCMLIEQTIYLNPGSCGPRRLKSECTYSEIIMNEDSLDVTFYKVNSRLEIFLKKKFEKRNTILYDCS